MKLPGPHHRVVKLEELSTPIRPVALLPQLREATQLVLLENPGPPTETGRYSFLGADPYWVLQSRRSQCWLGPPGSLHQVEGDPLAILQEFWSRLRGPSLHGPELPPLLSGALGYFGYELLYQLEQVPDSGRDDLPVPDLSLLFCGTVVAHDALTGRSWLAVTGTGDTQSEAKAHADDLVTLNRSRLARSAADLPQGQRERFMTLARSYRESRPRMRPEDFEAFSLRPVCSRAEYLEIVRAAREHILNGDIFEVCTAQRVDTTFTGSGELLYRVLRGANSAPFGAYLRLGELEIASASPERFLKLNRDRWVQTRPIKGTRPRGVTPTEDEALRNELSTSEKDRAENVMIVDLSRNDLGRVCRFGSVSVPELNVVESHPFTHQLVSTVIGQLRPDCQALDLLRAAFPGGSITGAPKVEAMKVIDRLEPVKRGVFSGSIGYLDFDGAMDLSIAIRTLVKRGTRVSFHVGGAVVADSDPDEEYQETLDKAYGLAIALKLAREELER